MVSPILTGFQNDYQTSLVDIMLCLEKRVLYRAVQHPFSLYPVELWPIKLGFSTKSRNFVILIGRDIPERKGNFVLVSMISKSGKFLLVRIEDIELTLHDMYSACPTAYRQGYTLCLYFTKGFPEPDI